MVREVGWCAEVKPYRDTWLWRLVHRPVLDGFEIEVESGTCPSENEARQEARGARARWLNSPPPSQPGHRTWVRA